MANGARPGSLVPPRNGTIYPGWVSPNDHPQIQLCVVTVHYNPIIATIFGLYIVIGLLYTYAGYRFFKTSMFLTGFIFACSLVYLICLQGDLLPSYGNAAVAAFAGLLFGLITMLVQYVGLFVNGLHAGLLIGLVGLLAADHVAETSPRGNVWLCIAVLLGCALLCAIFNLYFRKGFYVINQFVRWRFAVHHHGLLFGKLDSAAVDMAENIAQAGTTAAMLVFLGGVGVLVVFYRHGCVGADLR